MWHMKQYGHMSNISWYKCFLCLVIGLNPHIRWELWLFNLLLHDFCVPYAWPILVAWHHLSQCNWSVKSQEEAHKRVLGTCQIWPDIKFFEYSSGTEASYHMEVFIFHTLITGHMLFVCILLHQYQYHASYPNLNVVGYIGVFSIIAWNKDGCIRIYNMVQHNVSCIWYWNGGIIFISDESFDFIHCGHKSHMVFIFPVPALSTDQNHANVIHISAIEVLRGKSHKIMYLKVEPRPHFRWELLFFNLWSHDFHVHFALPKSWQWQWYQCVWSVKKNHIKQYWAHDV